MTAQQPRPAPPHVISSKKIQRRARPSTTCPVDTTFQPRPTASNRALTSQIHARGPTPPASPPRSNPHSPRRLPAITCLGAFPTPENAVPQSQHRMASENLHTSSRQPSLSAASEPGCIAEETGLIPDIRAVMSEAEGKLTVVRRQPGRRVIAEAVEKVGCQVAREFA